MMHEAWLESKVSQLSNICWTYDDGDAIKSLTQAIWWNLSNDDMVVHHVTSLCYLFDKYLWKTDLAYINHKNNIDESYLGKLSETLMLSLKVKMHVTFWNMSRRASIDKAHPILRSSNAKTMLELIKPSRTSVSIVMLRLYLKDNGMQICVVM